MMLCIIRVLLHRKRDDVLSGWKMLQIYSIRNITTERRKITGIFAVIFLLIIRTWSKFFYQTQKMYNYLNFVIFNKILYFKFMASMRMKNYILKCFCIWRQIFNINSLITGYYAEIIGLNYITMLLNIMRFKIMVIKNHSYAIKK